MMKQPIDEPAWQTWLLCTCAAAFWFLLLLV